MKLFVGLILSAFVLQVRLSSLEWPCKTWNSSPQALALPAIENPNAPEHIPENAEVKPKNEVVDAFREAIDHHFVRYQGFYDRTNAAMRQYRLAHVELVSRIYTELMVIMGDRIEEVRVAAYFLQDMIDAKIEEVGVTDCVLDVYNQRNENSYRVGLSIQACATYANTTLSGEIIITFNYWQNYSIIALGLLTNIFYPTFAQVQVETSQIPISVIDVLSRGGAK